MIAVVLDASAGVELALNTPAGKRLRTRISGRDPWVPDLSFTEVAGVLRRMELAGAIPTARANRAIDRSRDGSRPTRHHHHEPTGSLTSTGCPR